LSSHHDGAFSAAISFTPTADNTRKFFEIVVNNSAKWAREGWGGHVTDGGFIYVTPLLSLEEATVSMQPLLDYVRSLKGASVKAVVETSPNWLSFFKKYVLKHQGVSMFAFPVQTAKWQWDDCFSLLVVCSPSVHGFYRKVSLKRKLASQRWWIS
jgi:hypothetical protein